MDQWGAELRALARPLRESRDELEHEGFGPGEALRLTEAAQDALMTAPTQ